MNCRTCGAPLTGGPLITIENMPAAAQNLPGPEDRDTERGITVSLVHCPRCGMVQLDSAPVPYYRDVIRSGGYSTTMDRLRRSQYGPWIASCGLEGKKILEAGCGQGEFLKILTDYPVRAYGMEHKHDLVGKARAAGLVVEEAYPETEDQVFRDGPFDGFTSFNFLEHQPDPLKYLKAIANNLTDGAYGLVTVPSFEYILEESSFYELIPDHLLYFTMETLEGLMERCGFRVLQKERVNRDTLSVIVQKRAAEAPGFGKTGTAAEAAPAGWETGTAAGEAGAENGSCPRPDVSGILLKKESIAREVRALTEITRSEGKNFAVWGASHQGFTLCATTGIADNVSYIIDSAPFKHGKIAPASHIPIISPDQALECPPDRILIVAPGYTDEIAGIIRARFPEGTDVWTLMTDHLTRCE